MEALTVISLISITVINGYWTWQSRKIQNDRDVIKSLQIQLSLKEDAVQEMLRKKNEVKKQYEHQVALTKRLEGKIETYEKFHTHPQT